MRITFITNYTLLYGANKSLLNLIDGLKIYGVESLVVVPNRGEITSVFIEKNIPFIVCPVEMWLHYKRVYSGRKLKRAVQHINYFRKDTLRRFVINFRASRYLKQQLQAWRPDIIYSNTSVIIIGFLLAKLLAKPHIWHIREFGSLHYNIFFDFGKQISHRILLSSNALIFISHAIRSYYLGNRFHPKEYVIYNGIASESQFDELKSLSLVRSPNKAYTFAIVGQLHPSKKQDEAIKALHKVRKKYPNVRLLIAGSGHETPLRELASSLGVEDSVEFLGFVNNPFDVFLAADATLMCSRHEGMGRVTVESMAACCPVIGFNDTGTAELIIHEENGLLYKNGFEELALCMGRFIENPEWAMRLAKKAWIQARDKYSVEKYASQIFKVLTSISS